MASELKYDFEWIETRHVPIDLLKECSDLFSTSYGIWGPLGHRPGRPITLSAERIRPYLNGEGGRIALARHRGKLVCYATVVFLNVSEFGRSAWVTQLVTHVDYRQQKVASRVLAAIWGFSDFFAWGLVTANPYAVKALQNATTRRCDPQYIEKYAEALYEAGAGAVPYVEEKRLHVDYTQSIIDTDFHISHDSLSESIDRARNGRRWRLGNLHEGQEWFAFTFKEQPVDEGLTGFVRLQLADSDELLKRVYEGMSLDEKHIWTRYDDYEVGFIARALGLSTGDHILDLGCGKGRLTLKLAELGFAATGVDFVPAWMEFARREAIRRGLPSALFLERDARKKNHGAQRFDAGVCLYDVVGSYSSDEENQRILQTFFDSLRPGAKALLSVMNMTLTERKAKHRAVVEDDPVSLMNLAPSKRMQDSGEVFDPDYYLVDTKTRIVYRKEQFDLEGGHLPAELIVRDRRYSRSEIIAMAEAAGFELLWARHVRAGHWHDDLGESSDSAKEILLLLQKPAIGFQPERVSVEQHPH